MMDKVVDTLTRKAMLDKEMDHRVRIETRDAISRYADLHDAIMEVLEDANASKEVQDRVHTYLAKIEDQVMKTLLVLVKDLSWKLNWGLSKDKDS